MTVQREQQSTREAYDTCASEFASRFDKSDFGPMLRRFASLLPENGRILDLGCGSGRDLSWFTRHGFRATGVDWSRAMLTEARRRTDAPLVEADLRALPYQDAQFDGVWSNASFVHLRPEDLRLALGEVERVLRPDGVFFASIASGAGEEWRLAGHGRWRWFRYYQAADVELALSLAGLRVIDVATEPGVTHGTWINIWSVKP